MMKKKYEMGIVKHWV